jgi:hypothetical protein
MAMLVAEKDAANRVYAHMGRGTRPPEACAVAAWLSDPCKNRPKVEVLGPMSLLGMI